MSALREGYPFGSWGGKTHAVRGNPKDHAVSICGQSVSVGFQPWVPEVNGIPYPGTCKRCLKRWKNCQEAHDWVWHNLATNEKKCRSCGEIVRI